jgi:hypothetical protein
MADNIIRTIFQFLNDKQETNQLLRDTKRVDDGLESNAENAEKVTDAYSDTERAAKKLAKANKEVAEAGIKAAKEQSELVGDVAGRTAQLSGAAAGLGAIGGQRLMIAADIFDAAEAATLLRAEFPAMISQMGEMRGELLTMGAVGGGLALVTFASSKYNEMKDKEREKLEASREALAKYVDTLFNLNLLLLEGDAEGLEDALSEAEDTLAALRATRSDVEAEFNGIIEDTENAIREMMPDISDEQITRLSEAFLGLGEIPLFGEDARLFNELNFFQIASDEAARQARVLNEQLGDLDTQIEDVQTNAETTTGKIEELNAAMSKSSDAGDALDDAVFSFGSTGRLVANVFGDMVDNAIPLQAEMDAYNKILEEQEADALAAAAALFNLDQELENVGTSFEDIEKGAQAIADAEAARAKVIMDTEQSIVDVTAKGEAERADLITSTEREIADLQSDFAQDAADAERDYRDTIGEITRDFQQDSVQDLQDFQRDQRRAEEDHRDNLLDAAGRLDAVGILNEQRKFEKDQKRAKEDFDTEQKRRVKEFKIRLKDEEKAFKRERQQAERSYRERERDLRDSLNRQLADSRTAQNREIANLRGHQAQRLAEIDNALETELRALTGFTEEENMIRDEHYVQMLDQLQLFVDEANTIAAGLDAGGGGAVGAPAMSNTPGAVGQFPLSSGLRSPSGIASPFASPLAMMPPVSRSQSSSTRSAQVTNNFSGMDRLTPGQIRNVVKIINDEMLGALV